MLKCLIIIIGLTAINLNQFSQELEVISSLSSSSNQKFQGAHGVGLAFSKEFSKKIIIGLAGHYNFNSTEFDRVDQDDADFRIYYFSKITSCKVRRISLRLFSQVFLKNNDNASLSIGIEGSLNHFWGNATADHIRSNFSHYFNSYNYETKNAYGFGLISQAEIKNLFTPKISLCFIIRPELTNGGPFMSGASEQDFRGIIYYTEFQVGLKYRLNRN